jgi:alanine racemase
MAIALVDLLEATGGVLKSNRVDAPGLTFTDFCFDSRRARPGELFVALKTDRGDGHDFIADALAKGATGALIDDGPFALRLPLRVLRAGWTTDDLRIVRRPPSVVIVPDTFAALTAYARYIVRARKLPIVAITGSVGKSSAREAVAAVLGKRFKVFRNPSNFNGRLGLPIALGALEPDHEMAVLEMAADAPGEIRELCDIARPHIGVVTNVSEAHLAFFGSLDETAREKRALIEALPAGGLAILNRDDERVWAMREYSKARVMAVQAAGRSTCTLAHDIARVVGRHFNVPEEDIDDALSPANLPALPGRMNVLRGVNGATLIDDSFSASPASMRAAIQSMATGNWLAGTHSSITNHQLPITPNAFLVLGDMDQLGDASVRLHREIGALAASASQRRSITLVTLGELAQHIAEGALDAGMDASRVHTAYVARDAIGFVKAHAQPGDVILVKGDVSARMERVVAALLVDQGDRTKLARQEPGWESVRVARPARPTWIDVDLDAIAHNVRALKKTIGDNVTLMAVLKADGYGHGAVKSARTALNNGAGCCGVASLNEAAALRTAHIDAPILILGYTPAWHARDALLRDVAVALYDFDVARAFSRAARDLRRTAKAHIKIDTGMSRLGVLPDEAPDFIQAVAALPGIEIEGVFTHFSSADSDEAYTRLQLARFNRVLDKMDLEGGGADVHMNRSPISPRYIHAANSAAMLAYPESRFNMVRVGLAMYGLSPFFGASPLPGSPALDLRPALTWKTTIAQVKTLPPGTPVSYGKAYVTEGERRIAVIPVGYADGFRRAPNDFGEVLVRGRRAPLVGRVCMDQSMIDVTHIPNVRVGDEVALIGRQGDEAITVEDVAQRIGTISYEVVSAILPRVPRVS